MFMGIDVEMRQSYWLREFDQMQKSCRGVIDCRVARY